MRRICLALLCGLFLPAFALAANDYPTRPITLVVPFAAGSDSDLFAQNLAKHIRKHLDYQLIRMDYQPGESGIPATTAVLLAPADGYTLLEGRISTQVIAPALATKPPYRWDNFTTLAIVEIVPLICAVRADSPYRDVRDLLDAIRARPGQLKYSASGPGTLLNFAAQYLLHLAGIKQDAVGRIHLDSGAAATQALLDGRADFVCNNTTSLLPPIKAGKLRGLFTTAPGRLNALPQLPNAREVGLRDMGKMIGWTALIGPPGLPVEIVARWKKAFAQLKNDPKWLSEVERLGALPALQIHSNPEQFIQQQAQLYEQLITNQGMRP